MATAPINKHPGVLGNPCICCTLPFLCMLFVPLHVLHGALPLHHMDKAQWPPPLRYPTYLPADLVNHGSGA
jgi:hypothetical protein